MQRVDFAIITGLIEEVSTVLELLGQTRKISEDKDIWYRTRLKADNGRTYEVVVGYTTAMGPEYAASLTRRVIQQWAPAHVILVGLAGRFDDEIKLGDLLVSQQVINYDQAKATPDGRKYRPQGYPCGQTLIRQAEAFTLDKGPHGEWLKAAAADARAEHAKASAQLPKDEPLLKEKRPPKKPLGFDLAASLKELGGHEPRVFVGTIAAGSLVIADPNLKAELLRLHGKILGCEMEGGGMMYAAWDEEVPPAAVVIKGVSDLADGDKSKADALGYWRRLAIRNSVRLAIGIITGGGIRSLKADTFELDPTAGSAAQCRKVLNEKSVGAANLCFPELILPNGPITEIELEFHVFGADGKELPFYAARVRHGDANGKKVDADLKPGTNAWSSGWPAALAPKPVGLYLLVDGAPASAKFVVSNPYGQAEATWSK